MKTEKEVKDQLETYKMLKNENISLTNEDFVVIKILKWFLEPSEDNSPEIRGWHEWNTKSSKNHERCI